MEEKTLSKMKPHRLTSSMGSQNEGALTIRERTPDYLGNAIQK